MCLYPKLIVNRKYTVTKKNGGLIPTVQDKRAIQIPVGCGKCMECKKQKANTWKTRLLEEIRTDTKGKFVTLTLSNESMRELGKDIKLEGYAADNEIAKKAIRRYLERWRKKHKKSVKHWMVTEIGQNYTERMHIHGILFTDEVEDIKGIWKYGNVWIGDYVNETTIMYIVKYLHKTDEKHKEFKSRIFTSAGIGKGYMDRKDSERNAYRVEGTNETYRTREGKVTGLPAYYRNKIYTDEEREKLWMKMLDKEERYVDGIKIDVSKGMEQYNIAVEEARRKSKRLGYGDDQKDWDQIRYENSLRKQGQKIRSLTAEV